MHPLNIPELAMLIKKLKNHDPGLEGETDEKFDDILFKLMMNSSFDPVKKAKVYDINKYRKSKQNK